MTGAERFHFRGPVNKYGSNKQYMRKKAHPAVVIRPLRLSMLNNHWVSFDNE